MNFKRKPLVWAAAALVLFTWINNSPLFVRSAFMPPSLLAHRGLAQTFDLEGVVWDTNTARIIHEPDHPYLENTIPSMEAAFQYGADIVEFDVRLTKDFQLAVFHDFLLDYRTDGTGLIGDHTMDQLKKLDVGYGYTADEGKTFPFRGTGTGMMPSLSEVLETFPEREFLIHIKDGGEQSGIILQSYLKKMNNEERERISVYGNRDAVLFLQKKYPTMKVLTRSILVRAFIQYELIGWTGYIPRAMRNIEIHMPISYARLLWGWPDRFLQRMDRVNTRFVLVNGSGGFSSGFDDAESLERIPENFTGTIWTDRIDVIAPYFKQKSE